MKDFTIVSVDSSNVEEFGFFCIKNKKHPGYIAKLSWLHQRFAEGLRIKLIVTRDGKTAGFLEYVPGEFTWRVVNAPKHMVIHCLWVASNKFPYRGMASALLSECFQDAQVSGQKGVAVVTSDGPWLASQDVYLKYGFQKVDETEPHFQLLVKQDPNARVPKKQTPAFPRNWSERLKKFRGLQLLYTNQCPYIGKAVRELPPVAEKFGTRLKLVEFTRPSEAREKMPSPYGMVNLVYRGRLLADHPISATRFRNILQKEVTLKTNEK